MNGQLPGNLRRLVVSGFWLPVLGIGCHSLGQYSRNSCPLIWQGQSYVKMIHRCLQQYRWGL
jgi:hypothetical protein